MSGSADNSSYGTSSDSPVLVPHDIAFKLFGIVTIVINCLIIFTLFYFKRMRTVPNMYLVSWSIADLCSLLFIQTGLIVSAVGGDSMPFSMDCIFFQSSLVMQGATLVFVTLVALDWVFAAYSQRASVWFRKWYTLVLGVVWILISLMTIWAAYACWDEWLRNVIPTSFVMIALIVAACVVVLAQIIRLVKKLRKRSSEYPGLAINLATAFLACWALSTINSMITYLVLAQPFLIALSYCFVYASSIVNFALMYRYNNDFNACVRQIFSCKRIKYQDELGEGVLIQSNVNSNNVRIDFNNGSMPLTLDNARRM